MSDESERRSPRAADGDTEARILDAARAVFIRRGTAGARMQEIAAEAGVNQALLHYYFRSKERLAAAVFREAAGRLAPAIADILASDATLDEKVERFVHIYIDSVREQPYLPGYLLAELHHHPERLKALVATVRLPGGAEQRAGGIAPLAGRVMETLGGQLRERAAEGSMRPISPVQFLVNVAALTIFPFAARPVLELVFGLDDDAFQRFLDERRATLPGFILDALRP